MDPLQESELILLAEDIPHTKYEKLCDTLGFKFARSQSILATHHNDFIVAMQLILMEWKTKQTDATQSRSVLVSKLHDLDLGALGDKLSKGGYQPIQCNPRDKATASLQSSSEMATGRGIADELLANLAEDIETGEQVEALGRALGFNAAAINRYTETNIKGDRVTYKGTRDMLFDWRQTVEPSNLHLKLKQALIDARLVMLADTYIPDIYSEKISESLTVLRCREKLENKYLNALCKIPMKPWDPNDYAEFKDMHTVVTMVKKDSHGRDLKKKDVLQGSVAKIFSTKVNGRLPARILISAPAGKGKTTAVAKMAYDWVHRVKGSALEHLPLLFVLKLRNASQHTSIGEAIKAELLNDVDDLTPQGLEDFIRRNQGFCHIILDGLDEYAGISSTKQSLGSNIVKVIRWEEYPECRVLVTTRPHQESFFNQGNLPIVYTKMWIEGFSRESSREYIDKFFASSSDPSKAQGLKAYLDNIPLINELVITPLFCLMVCHLWDERLLGENIRTQTELLDSVNVFMMHHCNARLKPRREISEEKLHKIIQKLGQVALYGLLDDAKKLVFTPHDFRKVPSILEVACELGIISKTIVSSTCLPQSHKTISTTIEFYHKIVQEHSAGKYIAAESKKRLWPWQKTSLLERVLSKIEANIGDYENLIRFAAGTENNLCITIMEALLSNSFLDESERYRILLDCSSETSDTEGGVSSLVKRCVTSQRMVLKSPTVYTVVGMQNLPEQLKGQIREVKFEDSAPSTDVVSGLWSCMHTFSALRNLTISDCSLGFPPRSPELPSVMELKTNRVTSQSYEGLLPSIPNVKEIDIAVGSAEEEDISHIQTSLRQHLRGQELTLIRLGEPHSLPSEESVSGMSREMRGLGLLTSDSAFREATLFGAICGPKETVIDLVQRSTRLMSSSLYTEQLCGSLNSDRYACNMFSLRIRDCKLTAEITSSIWSCLRPFPSLHSLTISDSSLSFPPSPPELTSITKLKTERATSQSYEGLLSSIPNVNDITVGNAENEDMFQIQTSLRRHLTGQELTLIKLDESSSEESVPSMSREMMRGLGLLTSDSAFREVTLSGVVCGPEETVIDLVKSSTRVMSSILYSKQVSESLNSRKTINIGSLTMRDCKLTAVVASSMWSCIRSFPSLSSLIISDSSLSFSPYPPELTFITRLNAEGVTSQSYEGLLSSLPGLQAIDIIIDDAERDISHITAGLRRTGRQQLTSITIAAPEQLPLENNNLSRETMRGLSLLIREQTKNLQSLSLSGVKCTDEDYVDLIEHVQCSKIQRTLHFQFLGWGSLDYEKNTNEGSTVTLADCQLSTEMVVMLWTCLRSFSTLSSLSISGSSLSFPPSPPELTSVTKLGAKRVTSQSYEGLISSIPNVKEIDIAVGSAEEEDISHIQTSLRQHLRGQELTLIRLGEPHSLPSEESVSGMSREAMRGLGLHINDKQEATLSGIVCGPGETVIDLVQGSTRVMSSILYSKQFSESMGPNRKVLNIRPLTMRDCRLTALVTSSMWSCLRSFHSLIQLTISDSSLSFPPSPHELTSITQLTAKRVTSQSYEGLLSSLPGLQAIDIIIDDAERDISQITAGLHQTGGQQLTHITLRAQDSLPQEKKTVSRETMRGLDLLIREQTKNLQELSLDEVKCTDEEDLVYLIECCRHVKVMRSVWFGLCGTEEGGKLDSHLKSLPSSGDTFRVDVYHDGYSDWRTFRISRIH